MTTPELRSARRQSNVAGALLLVVVFAVLAGVAVGATLTARDATHSLQAATSELRSQGRRLATRGDTIQNLSDTVGVLSEQRFAKCRADRSRFEKILDSNSRAAFGQLLVAAVAAPDTAAGRQSVDESLGVWIASIDTYNRAVNAPDECKAI